MSRIFNRNLKDLLDPKWWIVIVAIPHTIFSALVPLFQSEVGSDYFTNATFGLLNTVVLVAIFLFTTGRAQARMVAVTATDAAATERDIVEEGTSRSAARAST